MPNFCSVEGCNKPCHAKGLCQMHYRRKQKYGDTESLMVVPNGLAKKYPTEHRSWQGAKSRCLKKSCASFQKYGGRGIKICDRWLGPWGFTNFIKDMGPKPSYEKFPSGQPLYSLDRIDNNGPYSPDNCRWATAREQTYNRGSSRFITINGETKTIQEWAHSTRLSYDIIWKRYLKGERGPNILRPSRKRGHRK